MTQKPSNEIVHHAPIHSVLKRGGTIGRRMLIGVAASALALGVAACGSDGNDSTSQGTSPATTQAPSTTAAPEPTTSIEPQPQTTLTPDTTAAGPASLELLEASFDEAGVTTVVPASWERGTHRIFQ